MVEREKGPSPRQRLLAAADELFYNEGIHTVGIDRIIDKAGVAKGSLYYNFDGKDDLVREYLLGHHTAWAARVDAAVSAAPDPRGRVLAVFGALEDLFRQPDYRGCTFVNAVAEARPGSPELKAAGEFRAWVHDLFDRLVRDLQVEDPGRLSDQLVILYDGAVAASQMDSTSRPAATARTMAELVMAQAATAEEVAAASR